MSLEVDDLGVADAGPEGQVAGVVVGEGLVEVAAEVALAEVLHFGGQEVGQFGFLDGAAVLGPEYFAGAVDAAHDVEEAGGVFAGAIEAVAVVEVPLVGVALAVAGADLPVLDLVGPVDLGDGLVLGDGPPDRVAGHEVEGVVPEEVVPEHEGRGDGRTVEVVVPLLQQGHDLVALLPQSLLREEEELGLPVDVDQQLLPLLYQRVSAHPRHEVEESLHRQLVPAGRHLPPGFDQELFLGGVHDVLLQVAALVLRGEVCVGDHQEVALEGGHPPAGGVLRGPREVGVQEVGGVLLVAQVLEDAAAVGQHQRVEGELQVLAGLSLVEHQLHQFAEDHPDLLLLLVPPGDVLRHLPPVEALVLLVEGPVGRVHVLALEWLLPLHLYGQGHVLQLDPGLAALVEELAAQGLDLLHVAAVDQDPREGPAHLARATRQQQRDARHCVGEDVSLGVPEGHRLEDLVHGVLGLDVLDQDGLSRLSDGPRGREDQVFLEEGDDRVQEVPEHQLVHVVVELVREQLVQPQPGLRLLPIHPGVGLLRLVPQVGPHLGPHPLQRIVVLQHEPIEPPHRVDCLNWVSAFRKALLQSRGVLLDQGVDIGDHLFLPTLLGLLLALFVFFFVFVLLVFLLEGVLAVWVGVGVPLLTN